MAGRGYTDPVLVTHTFTAVDHGGGADIAFTFAVPKGCENVRVMSWTAYTTELFTAGADFRLGITGDADKYFDTGDVGTPAVNTTLRYDHTSRSGTTNFEKSTDASADDEYVITMTQTGGTPTGIANHAIVLAFW